MRPTFVHVAALAMLLSAAHLFPSVALAVPLPTATTAANADAPPLPAAVSPAVSATAAALDSRAAEAGLPPTKATIALSAIRLLLPILQIKGEVHLTPSALAGGFLSWGSPATDVLDEKTQIEAGVHGGLFPLGSVRRGLGAVGQLAYMRATGRLGEIKADSYGVSGSLFASGRWTFDNDTLLEVQYGLDYLASYAGLKGGDGVWERSLGTRFNLWFGYSF